MSKRIAVALAALIVAIGLAGCHTKTEVGGVPIDARHTPASVMVKTDYVYVYDILNNKLALVPEMKQVAMPEKYEILWRITYDDGTCEDRWIECTKAEYEEVHHE